MSAWKRRKKYNYKLRRRSNNLLVPILTLIIIFQAILILFLIPKKPVVKAVQKTTPIVSKKITKPEAPKQPKQVSVKIKGRIAIVLDDWGYSKNNLKALKDIKFPLTLAVLPFQYYSNKIAEFARQNNFQVIIHMPMEPEDKTGIDLEPKTLMTDMSRQTIKTILNDAFLNVPYARGINNHMGSLATQDRGLITLVFGELKKRNLFFLDSFVVPDSVCEDISKEIGIKFAKRSIFIDNESSPEYIRGQIMELVNEVDKNGKAIGIGHDRKNTLLVLSQVMPQLAKEGYKFVFVSELAE